MLLDSDQNISREEHEDLKMKNIMETNATPATSR